MIMHKVKNIINKIKEFIINKNNIRKEKKILAKDKKALKDLYGQLNGEIYTNIKYTFNGYREWRDLSKARLDKMIEDKQSYLQYYSEDYYNEQLKEAEQAYTNSFKNCKELESKIHNLNFKIHSKDKENMPSLKLHKNKIKRD
jgi:hypothetical protein